MTQLLQSKIHKRSHMCTQSHAGAMFTELQPVEGSVRLPVTYLQLPS